MKVTKIGDFLFVVSIVLLLGLSQGQGNAEVLSDIYDEKNTEDSRDGENSILATGVLEYIVFSSEVPNSVYRTVEVPEEGADVNIFSRDCCIRDDIVDIYVDGCFLASVISIDGDRGTHPGETHTVSLGAGLHTVEYRNIQSGIGPSGWEVSETLDLFTGDFPCGSCSPSSSNPPITSQIYNFGTCDPTGAKMANWGSFNPTEVLIAENGDTLEIRCDPVGFGLTRKMHLEIHRQ